MSDDGRVSSTPGLAAARRPAVFVALAALLWVAAGWTGVASAHAILEASTPADGSVVPTSPAKVTLQFSEHVTLTIGSLRVFDRNGHRVDQGDASTRLGRLGHRGRVAPGPPRGHLRGGLAGHLGRHAPGARWLPLLGADPVRGVVESHQQRVRPGRQPRLAVDRRRAAVARLRRRLPGGRGRAVPHGDRRSRGAGAGAGPRRRHRRRRGAGRGIAPGAPGGCARHRARGGLDVPRRGARAGARSGHRTCARHAAGGSGRGRGRGLPSEPTGRRGAVGGGTRPRRGGLRSHRAHSRTHPAGLAHRAGRRGPRRRGGRVDRWVGHAVAGAAAPASQW